MSYTAVQLISLAKSITAASIKHRNSNSIACLFQRLLNLQVARESKTCHDIKTVPLSCIDYTRLLQIPSKFVQFQFHPSETTGYPDCSKGKRQKKQSCSIYITHFFPKQSVSLHLYMCVCVCVSSNTKYFKNQKLCPQSSL